MKKILLVIFLTTSNFSFAEDEIIMDYFLCSASLAKGLTECVQKGITKGWQPYGSPFGENKRLYQALEASKIVTSE